ncbi:hypothetical protein IAT38_004905 [Cryptococcus sp. DSM 104549]
MSGSIKAIDTDSVHRLHSGQVVVDLRSAIKELVENSLDAGATNIDVRIKDNGLESVEVSDNGSGIAESDWESIALKHHTSKLPSLADLYKVTTFGFRGEALSALCALCESVTIITATKDMAPMGAIIKLGRDGRVVDSSGRVARPRGTTITLAGLFVPIPVRRKEFERTAKRKLTEALTLMTAYALVPASVSLSDGRAGVRLKVEIIGAGRAARRSTQLATDGRGSLRASVGAVWGHKALDSVLDISLELDVEIDRSMARREGLEETSQTVKVSGLISSAQWGQGRSAADRQFYFINGRPCNLTRVAKAVNEVYKTFNTNQLPMAILDFQIPPQSVDINVSPDKRTIFVHSEDRLIEGLKTALDTFFQPSRSTFAVGGANQTVKTIRHIQSQLSMGRTQPAKETADGEDEEEGGAEEEEEVGEGDEEVGEGEDEVDEAPAGRSSSRRAAADPIPISDDEEDGDEPMQVDLTEEVLPLASSSSRPSRRRPSPPPSSPPAAPRRVVQQTISTTTASWSPDRKSRGGASSSASSRATGKGREVAAKDVRIGLRKRLEVYASQGAVVRDEESEEDDGAGGAKELEEDELEEDGTEAGEEEEEQEEEGEVVPEVIPIDEDDEREEVEEVAAEVSEGEALPPPPRSRRRPREEPIFEDESPVTERASSSSRRRPRSEQDVEDTLPAASSSSRPRPREGPPSSDEDIPTLADQVMDVDGAVTSEDRPSRPSAQSRKSSSYRDEIISSGPQGELSLRFDLPRLRARYAARKESTHPPVLKDAFQAVTDAGLAGAAGIANKDASLAEEALSRVISKADFERMEVLGQFNKGFIIARLKVPGDAGKEVDDLFIIDQHASDEKYNFETLQQTTKIKGQALIRPRPLQLTAGDEIVAMENLDILHSNGFGVKIDEEKPAGRGERVSLMAMPISKDTVFDFRDLEQLLHLLSDGSRPAGQMVRCSKARSMFASRACRKSVMIGKSLTKAQMVQLLRNMGTIDQPWNCPHGRPTMRHLTKLEVPTKPRSGRGRIDWVKWKAAPE